MARYEIDMTPELKSFLALPEDEALVDEYPIPHSKAFEFAARAGFRLHRDCEYFISPESAAPRLTLPWLPASHPPACDPDAPAGLSIECFGVVLCEHDRHGETVAWWPSRGIWTAMRLDADGVPYDAPVTVSHYFELPELPEAA
jgi:hypothetical protein